MSEPGIMVEEDLLVERIAVLLGFGKLSDRLPGDIYPPYLYLVAFIILDFGVVNTYIHFFSDSSHVFVSSPYVAVAPVALILGAVGIRYFSKRYTKAVENLPLDRVDTETAPFNRIIPLRIKLVMYGIAVFVIYAHYLGNVGIETILAAREAVSLVNLMFVWQVGYLPFLVEFGLLYFAIHVLLPRRIVNADVSMFFYDTHNMGGFAPVGKLLKNSYYIYTAGLLLYFVATYGAVLFSFGSTVVSEPGLADAIFFSTTWIIGVASIVYSMVTMHRVMSGQKEQRIAELEREIEAIIEDPYDINNSEVTDTEQLDDIIRRRQEIRDTRVYPASFAMWSQIAISVLFPQALNMAVQIGG